MNTLEIRSGNPSDSELVAIVMAVQALATGATQPEEPPQSTCWALSGPLNTQRRATLNAPGSPWQRSGHLTELW